MSISGILTALAVLAVAIGGAFYLQQGMADYLTSAGYVPDYTDHMVTEYCKAKIGSSPIDAITENLFLGDMCGTSEWSSISHRRISKILIACARCPKPKFSSKSLEKDMEVIKLNVRPVQDVDLLRHLPNAVSFIESSIKQKKNVLVSSLDGRSRSAAIVVAYLVKARDLTVQEAIDFVQNKRPVIELPHPIVQQLETYRSQLKRASKPTA